MLNLTWMYMIRFLLEGLIKKNPLAWHNYDWNFNLKFSLGMFDLSVIFTAELSALTKKIKVKNE